MAAAPPGPSARPSCSVVDGQPAGSGASVAALADGPTRLASGLSGSARTAATASASAPVMAKVGARRPRTRGSRRAMIELLDSMRPTPLLGRIGRAATDDAHASVCSRSGAGSRPVELGRSSAAASRLAVGSPSGSPSMAEPIGRQNGRLVPATDGPIGLPDGARPPRPATARSGAARSRLRRGRATWPASRTP